MKDYIKRVYGDKEHSYDNLRIYVKEAWEQITEEQLNSLIDSMRERCLAVIDAEGGFTKFWNKIQAISTPADARCTSPTHKI